MRELIPFPYKLSSADSINDGLVYTVPKFCYSNCNNPKCKQFYKTLLTPGEYVCPFGQTRLRGGVKGNQGSPVSVTH